MFFFLLSLLFCHFVCVCVCGVRFVVIAVAFKCTYGKMLEQKEEEKTTEAKVKSVMSTMLSQHLAIIICIYVCSTANRNCRHKNSRFDVIHMEHDLFVFVRNYHVSCIMCHVAHRFLWNSPNVRSKS